MKILAIGNSFSQDATRYLREIAKSNGDKIKVINLFIGGCPLYKHYLNILQNKESYNIQVDGENIYFLTSIQKALASDRWDIVTVQQASKESPFFEKYEPYLDLVKDTIKLYSPESKIYVHQTWAYHNDSPRLEGLGFKNSAEMFEKVEDAYNKMAEYIKADGIIPSGKLIQKLFDAGINHTHRDNHHISLGISRYAVALLWYGMLVNKDIDSVPFNDFDEEVTEEEIALAKKLVKELI